MKDPTLNGEKHRGRREIAIPDIVMHALEMPQPLARFGVERDQAVGEEIVTDTIRTVKIESGGACRYVNDAALGIDSHTGPIVRGPSIFPGVLGPRLVSEFAGQRNGVKRPAGLARPRVEGANIAGRRGKRFGVAPANDEQIFVDNGRAGERNERSGVVAAEIFAQVDAPVLAEPWNGFAGGCIQRVNKVHHADKDALVSSVGPERKAAVRLRSGDTGIKFPEQRAGSGIERENFLCRRNSVKGSVDDDRAGLQAAGFLRVERPRHFKLHDVGVIDLRQRRIVGVARTAAARRPILFCSGLSARLRLWRIRWSLWRVRGSNAVSEQTRCQDSDSCKASHFHGASLTRKFQSS